MFGAMLNCQTSYVIHFFLYADNAKLSKKIVNYWLNCYRSAMT